MKKITSFFVSLVCVSMLFLLTGCPKPADPIIKQPLKLNINNWAGDWQQFLTGITGNEFTKGVIVSTPKGV